MNPTELNYVSFVITAITTEEFPPRVYSTPFWEVAGTDVSEIIAREIPRAYEILGVAALDIRVTPITA